MSRSKQIGTKFETDLRRYLNQHGFIDAERRALSGSADCGDIAGTPYVWEAKSVKSITLASFMDETLDEIKNAKVRYGFLIVKRRYKSTGQAYAIMTLEQLCDMLSELGKRE